VTPLLMWWAKRNAKRVTLDTLKQVYVYPDFDLGQRSAESLNVFACIITYSGGMPVLYVFGMLYCFFAYWMDKYILLTASTKPPAYDSDIISRTVEWVPLFSFLHVLFALIFYSNVDIFPSDFSVLRPFAEAIVGMSSTEYDTVTYEWEAWSTEQKNEHYGDFLKTRFIDFSRKSVWLLMLMFCAAVAIFFLQFLYTYLAKPFLDPFLFAIKQKCLKTCCKCCNKEEEEEETEYQAAKALLKEKGLPCGYTMADNPKYSSADKAITYQKTLRTTASTLGSGATNAETAQSTV